MDYLEVWPLEEAPEGVWVYHTLEGAHLVGAWHDGDGGEVEFMVTEHGIAMRAETFERGETFDLLPEWEQIEEWRKKAERSAARAAKRSRKKEA